MSYTPTSWSYELKFLLNLLDSFVWLKKEIEEFEQDGQMKKSNLNGILI